MKDVVAAVAAVAVGDRESCMISELTHLGCVRAVVHKGLYEIRASVPEIQCRSCWVGNKD